MNALHRFSLSDGLWLVITAVAGLGAAAHALLHKRDSRSAWGWIASCWAFPLAGAALYYLIGINRLREQSQKRMGSSRRLGFDVDTHMVPLPLRAGVSPSRLRELVRIGTAMTGLPLSLGNRIEMLHSGDQAYPQMLDAIGDARHTIYLCTYIFERGEVGDRFIAALAAATRRGVKVRVLMDGIPDLFFLGRTRRLLTAQGVSVALFMAPRLIPPMLNIDLRNHRKLLIVDSRLAFTGGMNIRDCQRLKPPTKHSTTDLHFRVEGAVIEQLDAAFVGDWHFCSGEPLPPCGTVAGVGESVCRVVTDGPNQEVEILAMILLGALAAAHHRVLIMTPYFVPGVALLAAMQSAALRGVAVHVVLPARSNQRYVDWASRKFLEQLLKCGVQIWFRPAPFAHSKLFLIDDDYAQVGSANLDQRSLRLNFELMLEIYDPLFVAQLAQHHDQVRASCRPLTSEQLAERSIPERLRDGVCWLFSPYL